MHVSLPALRQPGGVWAIQFGSVGSIGRFFIATHGPIGGRSRHQVYRTSVSRYTGCIVQITPAERSCQKRRQNRIDRHNCTLRQHRTLQRLPCRTNSLTSTKQTTDFPTRLRCARGRVCGCHEDLPALIRQGRASRPWHPHPVDQTPCRAATATPETRPGFPPATAIFRKEKNWRFLHGTAFESSCRPTIMER